MPKQKPKSLFEKLAFPVKHLFDHKREPLLHTIEWVIMLLAFFAIGFSIIYSQKKSEYIIIRGNEHSENRDILIQTPEDQEMFTGKELSEPMDTSNWDTYQNKWYGFEIGHPDSWKNNTQYKTATEKSAVYETIYKFRKDEEENSIFVGYDVKIYSARKVSGVENTNDIHKKDEAPEDKSQCPAQIEEATVDGSDLTYKKISIDENNPCFEPAYFFSITEGDYIYNIVPAVGESGERFSDPEKETDKMFPEYKEAVNSFEFISIVRPQAKIKPRITARRPVAAKVVNGKLVCAKKNDKPGKSKNGNKPGHLDLECCLDPDERPNPWCTY